MNRVQQYPVNQLAANFDSRLESLRGLAALTVVLGHTVVIERTLDPNYQPTGIFSFQAPGHLSVLIFFMISGYVIGLTNQKPLTGDGILPYLKKRLVRIFPIYLVSILLTVIISLPIPWVTVAGNLVFGQVLLVPVLTANAPSWSLHYEVLFYLFFIPVSFFRLPPIGVCLSSLAAGLAVLILMGNWPGAPLLTSYLFGFCFWSLGLALVQVSRHNTAHYSNTQLISAFLLFFSLEQTNQLQTVAVKLTRLFPSIRWAFPDSIEWVQRAIALVDFSCLPYCVLLLLIFTNRRFPYHILVRALLYLLPAYSLVYLYRNRTDFEHLQHYIIPVSAYLLSLTLLLANKIPAVNRWADWLLGRTIRLGALSYGLYIVHYPILKLFGQVSLFSGHWYTYLMRLTLFIGASLGAAYLLEKEMQPWVRHFFYKPIPSRAHSSS